MIGLRLRQVAIAAALALCSLFAMRVSAAPVSLPPAAGTTAAPASTPASQQEQQQAERAGGQWIQQVIQSLCSSSAAGNGKCQDNGSGIGDLIDAIFDSVQAYGFGLAGTLAVKMHKVFWYVTALLIFVFGIQLALGANRYDEILPRVVRFVFAWGLVAWLFKDYHYLISSLDSGFDSLSTTVLGYRNPAITGGSPLQQGIYKFEQICDAMMTYGHPSLDTTGFSALLASIGQALGDWVMLMIAYLFLTIAAIIYVGIFAIAKAMIIVGIAIGPVMLPWFIVPYFRDLFDGWIRFLITGGLYKLVGTIMFLICGQILVVMAQYLHINDLATACMMGSSSSLCQQTAHTFQLTATSGAGVFILIVLSALIIALMLTVPAIVNHLMSGRGQVGQGVWAVIVERTGGVVKGVRDGSKSGSGGSGGSSRSNANGGRNTGGRGNENDSRNTNNARGRRGNQPDANNQNQRGGNAQGEGNNPRESGRDGGDRATDGGNNPGGRGGGNNTGGGGNTDGSGNRGGGGET